MKVKSNSSEYTTVCAWYNRLKSGRSSYREKALIDLQVYSDTYNLSLDSFESTVGLYKIASQYDTTMDMSINITKSIIDTLTSFAAGQKVRPFLNTAHGSYKDVLLARQGQKVFDRYFEVNHIFDKMAEVFRNACIFDTGWMDCRGDCTVVLPWQVFFDINEMTYGKTLHRLAYERKNYPIEYLPDEEMISKYRSSKITHVTFTEYWDVYDHKEYHIYDDGSIYSVEYTPDVVPFIYIQYQPSIVGGSTESIVDMLLSIQIEINILMNKCKDASQLSPANTVFVPQGSTIHSRKLNNGIGQVVGYTMQPGITGSPVVVSTPPFIDPEYSKLFESLKQTASDMVGVSQLAQAAKKPAGLNSGVAIQTMEDLQSERLQVQIDHYIRAFVDLVKVLIHIQDGPILPKDKYTRALTWNQLQTAEGALHIQFSASDAIGKDPQTKLQVLQMLVQMGAIPQSMITTFLEIPDLDNAYDVSTTVWGGIQTCIERCLEKDIYEVPPFVNYQLLQSELVHVMLSLYTADPDGNVDYINKCAKLFKLVSEASTQLATVLNPPMMEEVDE